MPPMETESSKAMQNGDANEAELITGDTEASQSSVTDTNESVSFFVYY